MTLYSDASTVVRTGQGDSNRFDVKGVARQSSVFSPLLFAIVIDIVTTTARGSDGHTMCLGYLSYDMDQGDMSRGKKEI